MGKLLEIFWILKSLNLSGNEAILDVACGTGFWTRRIARKARLACGADLRPDKLSRLGGRSEANGRRPTPFPNPKKNSYFVAAGAECLPFAAGSFDKVMSVCALEHFDSDREALAEINRVLKDRGILAMTVDSLSHPAVDEEYRKWHSGKYFCNNYYTLGRMKELLAASGFEIFDHKYLQNSGTSFRLVRFFQRKPRRRALLVPVMLAISLVADYFADPHCGMILGVAARKTVDLREVEST